METHINSSSQVTNNIVMEYKEESAFKPGRIYLLPLILFLCAPQLTYRLSASSSIGFNQQSAVNVLSAASTYGFLNDPSQIIIRGLGYLLALLLVMHGFRFKSKILLRSMPYLFIIFYAFLSLSWSSFPGKVVINLGHLIGMMLAATTTAWYFHGRSSSLFSWLALLNSYPIFASLISCMLIPSRSVAPDGRWFGILKNANSLGIAAIVTCWASAAMILSQKNKRLLTAAWILMIASWVVLIGSQSKTSLICFIFLTVFFLIVPRLEFASGFKRIVYIAGAICFMILFGLIVYIINPELLTLDGSLQLLGKERHLSGRTTVWLNAWELIKIKPWFGWSFDSNMTVIYYMKNANKGVGQFLSGYIDLLVRAGWIGITLFIMFLVQITIMILHYLRFSYRTGICYLAFFMTFLIHNFTEASILRDSHVFWFLILVIYFDLSLKTVLREASHT